MCSRANFTSWGQGASLALVDCPFSDGVTIKMSYRVDVLLHRPALHPIFSYFLHDLSPWRYMSRCFLVALCRLVLWRVNLKVATKRHLHQQLKIPGSFRAKLAHEGHNSLKLSFTNIWALRSNFVIVNLSLNQTLLTFLLYLGNPRLKLSWELTKKKQDLTQVSIILMVSTEI